MIKKFTGFIKQHKIISLILLVVIAGAGYYGYGKFFTSTVTEIKYVLAEVEKGTLINSVSGSGQVSASNQIDVKPKASGDVTRVNIKAGDEVKSGQILAQLDSSDAYKTVRDAETSLESAQLSMEKLVQPATALEITQAENSLTNAIKSKEDAEDDLEKAYDDGFTDVSNAFLELPGVISGLDDLLFSNTINSAQWNLDYYYNQISIYDYVNAQIYRDSAYDSYEEAREKYVQNFNDYKSANRYSDKETIEELISETYETTKLIADAVKNTNNLIQFYQDQLTKNNLSPISTSDDHLTTLGTYTSETNSHLSTLLSIKTTIQSSKDSIESSDRTIEEKTESLAELKAGADSLDVKSQELTIKQKQIALADAKSDLADYIVRSPIDGVVATVDVKKGDTASSGTAVATIISKQQMAEITLNEVDVAKVAVGQKATLTFDAVSDLTISGSVAEVDTIGSTSSGVVSYTVKISFDEQDERIKPGMTVMAAIITESKVDVLTVPNNAIKSSNDVYYVEMPTESVTLSDASSSGVSLVAPIKQQLVEIGLQNDTVTEILSGLTAGDVVIIRTVSGSATTSSSTSSNSRSGNQFIFGGGGFGGGQPPN